MTLFRTLAMTVAAAVEKESRAPMPAPMRMHRGTSATYHAPVISPLPGAEPFTRFAAWNCPWSPERTV